VVSGYAWHPDIGLDDARIARDVGIDAFGEDLAARQNCDAIR
jgi:hypothetical protein